MIEEAIKAFRKGRPVLIYDFEDREGETDIAIPARAVKPEDVAIPAPQAPCTRRIRTRRSRQCRR